MAESFRWFALAANQGDADAAKKRDDVAGRLDAQSLTAAKLAVQQAVSEAYAFLSKAAALSEPLKAQDITLSIPPATK